MKPLHARNRSNVRSVETAAQLSRVRDLFRAYQQSLGVDLCFQGFADELAGLPGDYAPPGGELVLAWAEGEAVGCGAMRALPGVDHPNACELKRVYVQPQARGMGLGRQITEHLIERARAAGYGCMLLDTLDDMATARDLYASLGFVEVAPYYFNPIAGAHYLKLAL